jgi:putative peptidoglycan lipid II flippase
MSKMLKSSGAMALATLSSRLLGMVRSMVYASFMGDSWVAGAFSFAFQIPNLFRRLLGEGALTAAFIPAFTEKRKNSGETEMWRASNAVISGLVIVSAALVGLVMLGISLALAVHQFDEKTTLMLRLLRLMFPYMTLVCVAAVFMGMLNARGHFFIPAMGATMLNVVMITSVLWLAPKLGAELPEQIFALAFGVLAAGVAQAGFQLPALWRDGFALRWVSPWRDETVHRVVKQMIPGTIGVAAFQINVFLTGCIAFWFDPKINAAFDYATRLMEFPQGMIGISLATFLLPALTELALDKNYSEYRTTLRHGLATMLFANLIASALLLVLAEPIVRLIYEHGKFSSGATERVSFALIWLAPGLVAFSTVNILARAFYALNDTKTPMKISAFCLVLNLPLSFVLVWRFKQGGLGMANTATSVLNVVLLTFALRKKLKRLDWDELWKTLLPLALITVVAGIVALQGWRWWEARLGHATVILKIGAVFGPAIVAGLIYWVTALAFKIPAALEMTALVWPKRSAR